jgi:predicted nucleotidyltransferase
VRKKDFGEYSSAHLARLKNVVIELSVGFGKLWNNLYLVGGLVPDLLVKNKLPYLKEYLGTLDIDLAVEFAVDKKTDFTGFYERIRAMGFEKQKTPDGAEAISHSFIKYEGGYKPLELDLLADDNFEPQADKLIEITQGVDAVKFRGVYLVFKDFIKRHIQRKNGGAIEIKIPNIIPFLTLKAFAYLNEENRLAKDAFDIWYTVVNFKDGPDSVREELLRYKGNLEVEDAFGGMRRLFNRESSPGVKDVADILISRYGLERARANNEVIYPLRKLFL